MRLRCLEALLFSLGVLLAVGCSGGASVPADTETSDIQEVSSLEDALVDVGQDQAPLPDLPLEEDLAEPSDEGLENDPGVDTLDSVTSEDPGMDVSSTLNDTLDSHLSLDVPPEPTPDAGSDLEEIIPDTSVSLPDPGVEEPDSGLGDLMNDMATIDATTGSCDPSLCVSSDECFSATCVDGVCQLLASDGCVKGSCNAPLSVPLSHENPIVEVTIPANQLHSIMGLDICLAPPGAGQYLLQFQAEEGDIVALSNSNSEGGTQQFVLSVRDTCGQIPDFAVCGPQNLGIAGTLEGGTYYAVVNQWLSFGASIPFLQWNFTMHLELLDEIPANPGPDPSE